MLTVACSVVTPLLTAWLICRKKKYGLIDGFIVPRYSSLSSDSMIEEGILPACSSHRSRSASSSSQTSTPWSDHSSLKTMLIRLRNYSAFERLDGWWLGSNCSAQSLGLAPSRWSETPLFTESALEGIHILTGLALRQAGWYSAALPVEGEGTGRELKLLRRNRCSI